MASAGVWLWPPWVTWVRFPFFLPMRPLLAGGIVPENAVNVRSGFFITALFFLIFSLPLFLVRSATRKSVTAGRFP